MQKNRYEVYQVNRINDGHGNTSTNKSLLCSVIAESAANAVQYAHAMFNVQAYCPYQSGGFRQSEVVAEPAK